MGREHHTSSLADEILDEVVPLELDWQGLVMTHPKTTLAVAAAAGFWLGRTRGRRILAALSSFAAETVDESINEFFGRDVL
jgi:hypothetical protein